MTTPLHLPNEPESNAVRDDLARFEPRALRTYTPTQAVLARSAGVFHWTAEGRRLYDYTSGVLVANLGHNPGAWMRRRGAKVRRPLGRRHLRTQALELASADVLEIAPRRRRRVGPDRRLSESQVAS